MRCRPGVPISNSWCGRSRGTLSRRKGGSCSPGSSRPAPSPQDRRHARLAANPAGDRDYGALWRACDTRLMPPVDQRMRRMEYEIDHPAIVNAFASQQPRIKLARFRADAGKRIQGGEQGVEKGRAHAGQTETRIRSLARLTIVFSAFIEPLQRALPNDAAAGRTFDDGHHTHERRS